MHSAGERETVPLSIHHLPFALTFAFFGVRQLLSVMPTTGGCTHKNAWGFALPDAVQRQVLGCQSLQAGHAVRHRMRISPNRGHELKIPLACCTYRMETWWC